MNAHTNAVKLEELDHSSSKRHHIRHEKTRCRFKGVVPHQNGHWGAQIYANHQRIWLGTFKTEREAAMAYDRAAMKFRSDDSYRNIHLSPTQDSLEVQFQRHLSEDDLLGMIKDGSYNTNLAEFSRACHHQTNKIRTPSPYGYEVTKLFEKVLTPSDIGKLNRLVIPKKCAYKFRQKLLVTGISDEDEPEVELFDREMNCWRFRFCYWKSSQSFVFTKGWNKFVKAKSLKPHDVVVLSLCRRRVAAEVEPINAEPFFAIDVILQNRKLEDKVGTSSDNLEKNRELEEKVEISDDNFNLRKEVRLFGVDITS